MPSAIGPQDKRSVTPERRRLRRPGSSGDGPRGRSRPEPTPRRDGDESSVTEPLRRRRGGVFQPAPAPYGSRGGDAPGPRDAHRAARRQGHRPRPIAGKAAGPPEVRVSRWPFASQEPRSAAGLTAPGAPPLNPQAEPRGAPLGGGATERSGPQRESGTPRSPGGPRAPLRRSPRSATGPPSLGGPPLSLEGKAPSPVAIPRYISQSHFWGGGFFILPLIYPPTSDEPRTPAHVFVV